jgi:type I restriction enzyme M protein
MVKYINYTANIKGRMTMSEDQVNELIQTGIQRGYFQVDRDKITYANNKQYQFTDPEEKVRAALYTELIEKYEYPINRIDTEVYPARREPKLPADLVVYKDDDLEDAYIVIEIKSESIESQIRIARREGLGNSTLLNSPFLLTQCGLKREVFDVSSKPSLKSLDKYLIADIPVSYGHAPKYRFKKADPDNDLRYHQKVWK